MKKVGYWMSEKKTKKMKFDAFAQQYKSEDLCFTKIDLSRPIEEQGHFDLIVNKFVELSVLVDIGSEVSKRQLDHVQSYIKSHPDTILVDSMDKMMLMLSREQQVAATAKAVQHPELRDRVFVPAYCSLTSTDPAEVSQRVKQAGVTFPVVSKPELTHGLTHGHQMSIVFNEKNLKESTVPCVLQSFINHNAKIYKVFVIGSHHYVCERPSIKNLKPGDFKTLFFHTHEVSKNKSESVLNECDDPEKDALPVEPDYPLFSTIARICRTEFNLELLGIDVIMCPETRKYAIIDVNTFPGYDGKTDFFVYLERLVREKLHLPILNEIGRT